LNAPRTTDGRELEVAHNRSKKLLRGGTVSGSDGASVLQGSGNIVWWVDGSARLRARESASNANFRLNLYFLRLFFSFAPISGMYGAGMAALVRESRSDT
jgi:hypothetical protein